MSPVVHKLKRFCALLVGLVFFLSGIFKVADPVGTGLIVQAYLKFFHLSFLDWGAEAFGVVLSLLECLTGVALVTGVFRRLAAGVVVVMTAIFTLITLALLVFNPSMDCGCFGEVVHLTHLQSFLKNIALLALEAVAFLPWSSLGMPRKTKYAQFWVVAASVLAFAVFALLYIPPVDFTSFNRRSQLAAAQEGGVEPDVVPVFIYRKGEQEGVFNIDRLPDSTWTFVRQELITKQDNISETDYPVFALRNTKGESCDSVAIADKVLVFSVYKPQRLSDSDWNKLMDVARNALDNDFVAVFALSAAPSDLEDAVPVFFPTELREHLYSADYKTLLSLNRSNGGATYFADGNLINKWARRELPSARRLASYRRIDAMELMLSSESRSKARFQAFLLYLGVVMLVL